MNNVIKQTDSDFVVMPERTLEDEIHKHFETTEKAQACVNKYGNEIKRVIGAV